MFSLKKITDLKNVILFIMLVVVTTTFSQNKKQLQAKRVKLQKEIKQINKLLSKTKKDEKTLLSRLGDINKKVEIRQKLINTINNESKNISLEINKNKSEITTLTTQLEKLKKEYANMVVQSYKHKNKQDKLLFLIASDNFTQAYKRMQYMKQYTNHRKNQAQKIKEKQLYLAQLNDTLLIKKKLKDNLVKEKIEEKRSIDNEKTAQQKLIKKVKQKEKKYISRIRRKQNEERKFENQLEDLINGVIKKSNKGSASRTLKLSPEAKKLASSFVASKGKLPWPVAKGYVSRYFGERAHEQLKKIKVKSNGWHFITEKNAVARSIFKGKVFAILVDKKTKLKTVLLQHGNYFTAYKNLTTLFVDKGDIVNTKQELGTIHTNKTTGKTKLVFALMKNTVPQNPSKWLSK